MKKHLLPAATIVLLLTCGAARGQTFTPATLNAAGGSSVTPAGTFEYSVGEMTLVSTESAAGIIVTQGVLQTLTEPAGIGHSPAFSASVQVFPNPAENGLTLSYAPVQPGRLIYSLQDAAGKELVSRALPVPAGTGHQYIDLSSYAAGIYMLQVTFGAEAASFKIQKTH